MLRTSSFFILPFALAFAGCLGPETPQARAWGKPVVNLSAVIDATGAERDLVPSAPFDIPTYPDSMLYSGWEGFVDVKLLVRPNGTIKEASILKSSQSDFEAGALAAVKTWQFPAAQLPPSRDPRVKDPEIDLVARIRFSIEQFSRTYGQAEPPRKSSNRSGNVTPSSVSDSSRSHEMKVP